MLKLETCTRTPLTSASFPHVLAQAACIQGEPAWAGGEGTWRGEGEEQRLGSGLILITPPRCRPRLLRFCPFHLSCLLQNPCLWLFYPPLGLCFTPGGVASSSLVRTESNTSSFQPNKSCLCSAEGSRCSFLSRALLSRSASAGHGVETHEAGSVTRTPEEQTCSCSSFDCQRQMKTDTFREETGMKRRLHSICLPAAVDRKLSGFARRSSRADVL